MKTNHNWWPAGIITAFVLFFIGMAGAVVIASTHREHLVNANYYEQELKFQGQINAARRAQISGATVFYSTSERSVIITLPVVQLTEKFSGTVELYRPSAPELDREFLLQPMADGTQTFDVSRLATGLWLIRVKWSAGGEDFFLEQKFAVAGK